ncbi:peptidylprolyl isomerase [Puteibacter caeruleilacunae]|nr:peptidylprolyl isomerase [Puteibacter caeruleilacunae]
MATLQKIRNQAGLLIAIIIGMALVAFILGDMLKSGSSLMRSKQMEIADINGETIDYREFQRQVEELGEVYKMNTGQTALDDNTWMQLREQTFQTLVRTYVMGDVYENLGLGVTSNELADMVQGSNPHPIIQQIFRNPNTGQFDRTFLLQFLKNRDLDPSGRQRAYWMYLEDQIFNDRLQTKYNNLLSKGLYITKSEAQSSLEAKNRQVDMMYVKQTFNTIPDSLVQVTDNELKNYYEANKEDYKQGESRRIEYVSFDVVPSASDDADTKKWVEDIKQEFADAKDNAQFVNLNSDNQFEDVFFKETELKGEVAGWAFTANEGDVYGPYKEGNVWKLTKISSFENLPDSVKARHILIQPKGQADVARAQALVDSLETVVNKGANFAKLAEQYSEDKGSAVKGGDLGWFKKNQMVKPFEKACFTAKRGDVVVVQSRFGFHLIKVERVGKTTKQVQIATLDRTVEASSQTYQDFYAKASKFSSENRDAEAFKNAITEQKLNKRIAILGKSDRVVNGMQHARMLVRSAYKAEPGEILMSGEGSPIFEIGNSFIVSTLVQAKEEGYSSFEEVKARVELKVKKEKKGALLAEKMKKAKDATNTIEGLGVELKANVQEANNINFNSYSLPGSGNEPAVIGTVSKLAEGTISNPIIGKNGVYVVEVKAVKSLDDSDVDAEQMRLAQSLAYRTNYQAFQVLKDAVEIVDDRARFY